MVGREYRERDGEGSGGEGRGGEGSGAEGRGSNAALFRRNSFPLQNDNSGQLLPLQRMLARACCILTVACCNGYMQDEPD
jgi:hypothetical protein